MIKRSDPGALAGAAEDDSDRVLPGRRPDTTSRCPTPTALNAATATAFDGMPQPRQAELRHTELATMSPRLGAMVPIPSTTNMQIRRWQPYRTQARTTLGYLSAEAPRGMIMNDLKLMVGLDGRHWIAMPAIPQVDKDRNPRLDANGKQSWSQIIEFTTREATHKFRETALEVMRRQHPEPFNEADP